MKIYFIGTVEFSKYALEKLIEIKAQIVGVATKADLPFNADLIIFHEKFFNRFPVNGLVLFA
jgi:methionyl-tRNA formyltransferase